MGLVFNTQTLAVPPNSRAITPRYITAANHSVTCCPQPSRQTSTCAQRLWFRIRGFVFLLQAQAAKSRRQSRRPRGKEGCVTLKTAGSRACLSASEHYCPLTHVPVMLTVNPLQHTEIPRYLPHDTITALLEHSC